MHIKLADMASPAAANGASAPSVPQSSLPARRNTLDIPAPRTSSFHIPEGVYQARIYQVKNIDRETDHGTEEWIRLLFDVNIPGSTVDNTAKADFEKTLEYGTPLRNVIVRLLGKAVLEEAAGQTFSLEMLIGLDCIIEVIHSKKNTRKQYSYPLVIVRNINPVPRKER